MMNRRRPRPKRKTAHGASKDANKDITFGKKGA